MMLDRTTLMPCARANSAIDARLPSISSSVIGPVLPAMSLVPARITTTRGARAITSGLNRSSICGVVWPLMPRSRYGLPGKKPPKRGCCQESVIESPMKTTRASPGAGALVALFDSR